MQLKLLGIAGTTSISATAAAIKGLSKEEAIAALATTELNETEMAAALVKAGYTNATATQTAALAVEAREQEAEAAATLESAAADTVATGTTTGLSVATTGLTTVLKGLWATLMANPFVLVLAGLAALIAAVDAYQKRVERAAEALSNSSEEVKSLQSEIDNLNSELKTTQDKIEELLRKPSPTIVEKNELKNLQITNNELERQIKLKERALKVSQGKNADNFVNAVNSKKTENGGDGWWFGYRNYGDFKTTPYKDKDHPNRPEANTTGKSEEQYYMFQVRLEDYQEAEAKYQKALQDGNEQEAKQWEERKTELNTAMSGYVSDMTGYLTDLGEYDYSALSDDAKAAVDYINDIQNAYLMATGNSGDSVFSNIFNQGRFAEGKKAIDELKESGKLTADTLANLYESNSDVKALIDNMKQVGLINDTTADTFNSLTNQIIGTSNALKQANTESIDESNNLFTRLMNETGTSKDPSFVESIEKSIEKLQKLQDALTKVESGTLKDSERMSLFKTFPQLTAYANNLSEGIKHVTESMRGDIVEKFSDQISKFNEQGASASEIAQLEAYQKTVLGIADAVVTTQNALSSMQTVFQDLDKIVKDYNENQYFSLESLEKLSSSSGQKYLQYLTYENGQLKVNEEAYKKLVLAQIDEIETKATLQATTDLESLSSETAAKEYLAKVNIELADSQLTAAQAAFQYALALKLAEGGNVAKAAQKVADNLNTLRNIFASAREQAKSYSGAMLGAATATDKKAKASEKAKDALEKEKTALEHSKEALEQEKKALEKNKSEYEKAKNAIQDLIEWTQKYIKQIKENEIKALEEQKDKFDEIIEKRKEQLQAEKDLHEYEKSLSEKQNTLASNALKAAVASLDDSAAGKKAYKKAQEEYKTSQTDLQDFLYEHEIDVRQESLDKLKEDTDKSYQDQIDTIQDFLNDEVKMYREACSIIDNDNGSLYGKLLDYCLNYTTTGRAEFDHMWTEAKSAMDKYNTANLSTIDLINDLQGRIYEVDSAIDTLTTNIETYENRISNLKNQIDDLKDAAIEAKNAIDAANSTPLNPDPTNGKTSLWVKYNGKKYETGYNYNGDTEANRLLAASELTKIIAKDVSGFDNYGLSIVQGLLGVGGNKTGHHWTYTFQGKTYESRAATRDNAIADILSQISKKFGGVYPASASTIYGTIKGYAEGTKAATGGVHIVDEEGLFSEFIPYQVGKGRYSFLPEGNPVFSKAMTNTMFDFASDPADFVNSIRNDSSKTNLSTNVVINIAGNADRETVKQLKRLENDIVDKANNKLMDTALSYKRLI